MRKCSVYCGICYSNVRGRSNIRGHQGYRVPPQKGAWEMALMRKRDSAAASGQKDGIVLGAGGWGQLYPSLVERLTLSRWPDTNKPRDTDTLSLSIDQGSWKACLRDRDEGYILFAAGDSPDDVLERLEAMLADDTAEWRKDKFDRRWSKKNQS